jgi:hypothetical protein
LLSKYFEQVLVNYKHQESNFSIIIASSPWVNVVLLLWHDSFSATWLWSLSVRLIRVRSYGVQANINYY